MEKDKSLPLADIHFQISAKVKFQIQAFFPEFSASPARLLDSFSVSDLDTVVRDPWSSGNCFWLRCSYSENGNSRDNHIMVGFNQRVVKFADDVL